MAGGWLEAVDWLIGHDGLLPLLLSLESRTQFGGLGDVDSLGATETARTYSAMGTWVVSSSRRRIFGRKRAIIIFTRHYVLERRHHYVKKPL